MCVCVCVCLCVCDILTQLRFSKQVSPAPPTPPESNPPPPTPGHPPQATHPSKQRRDAANLNQLGGADKESDFAIGLHVLLCASDRRAEWNVKLSCVENT